MSASSLHHDSSHRQSISKVNKHVNHRRQAWQTATWYYCAQL